MGMNLDIESKKARIECLDKIDDAMGLEAYEIIERNRVSAKFLRAVN